MSNYAIRNSPKKISKYLKVHNVKKKFPFNSRQFGWPVKKNFGKGRFWTDENSYKELERILNFFRKKNYKIFNEMK